MKQTYFFSLAPALPGWFNFPALILAGGVPSWLPRTVNLIIFFGALYFLLRKPTREFFQQRYTEIRAALERAAKEKEAAQIRLAEIDARLNKLDAEIAEIRSQAEKETIAERERIETQSRQDAEKLRVMAQREIESAKNSALAELQQFTATQAVAMAEQMIRRELTADDDARLFNRMTQEIQKATQSAG